jgi:hypothetical protein
MQKIITFALFEGKIKSNISKTLKQLSAFEDRIEVYYHIFGGKSVSDLPPSFTSLAIDDYSKFVKVAAGLAKGTYFLCTNFELEVEENKFDDFLQKLTESKFSVLTFNKPNLCNVAAIKTADIKKIAYNEDLQESSTYLICNAILNTKSCNKLDIEPFKIHKGTEFNYHIENFTRFKNSVDKFCERFSEERSKLSSAAYKITFDILCALVAERYICSIFLQIKKRADEKDLTEFDNKIKGITPFIYFGAEKQFKAGDLKKLREKGFAKIPFITSQKIKTIIKND